MAKFSKPFCGCKSGDIHPTDFLPGDECPAELEDAARQCEALEKKAQRAAPDNKAT